MKLKRWWAWLAVACGLGVTLWLFIDSEDSAGGLQQLAFTPAMSLPLAGAVLCFVLQNLSMAWRYRLLSARQLSFKQALRVDLLCEFASALTPSAAGGSSVNFIFINHEGISLGRSSFISLISLFFDELFLAISCLLILCFGPQSAIFSSISVLHLGVFWSFVLIIAVVAVWAALLFVVIFIKPQVLARCISWVLRFPAFRRFKPQLVQFNADVVQAAAQSLAMRPAFWSWAFVLTACSWCARFAVAVFILLAFGAQPASLPTAYMQQWVMWVVMLIAPTPGGAGFSEIMFRGYYASFLPSPGLTVLAALIWRIIFYYSYLIAGALCFPSLLNRHHHSTPNPNPNPTPTQTPNPNPTQTPTQTQTQTPTQTQKIYLTSTSPASARH